MPNHFTLSKEKFWSRRQLLTLGLTSAGVVGATTLWQILNANQKSRIRVPPTEISMAGNNSAARPMTVLRNFDYGTVKSENGRTIRQFELTAGNSTIQLNDAVSYNIWNLNGRIPVDTASKTGQWRADSIPQPSGTFPFFTFSWCTYIRNGWDSSS